MRVNSVIDVNGSKQKEHQHSEEEQEPFEAAKGSVRANSHHKVESPPKWVEGFAPDLAVKVRNAYSFRLNPVNGQLGKPLTNNGRATKQHRGDPRERR